MAKPICEHPTPEDDTQNAPCVLCPPTQYQCQQSTCLQWQECAPHCRFCHTPLTGQRSGTQLLWEGSILYIREHLGGGGMGEVYRGFREISQSTPQKYVAIKFNKEIEAPERFARFKREVGHLTRLQSPYCVSVLGYGEHSENGVLQAQFMIMELLHGAELAQLLDAGPLPASDVLALCQQLLEALSQIHAQGVIHRDLKPDNIMLVNEPGAPYQAKLFDFGLAKDLSLSAPGVSASGIVMGTPWYMSPEQAKCEPVDQRSDLFSLGIILYEMLTGTRPYPAKHLYELFQLHIQPPPLIPMQLPHPLPALLQGTLAYDPDDRLATANDCLDLLSSRIEPDTYGYFRPLPTGVTPLPSHNGPNTFTDQDELPPPLPSWLLGLLLLFVLGSGSMAYVLFDRAKAQPSSRTSKTKTEIKKPPQKRSKRRTPTRQLAPPLRTLRVPTRTPSPITKRKATKQMKGATPSKPSRYNAKPQVTLVLEPPCTQLSLLLPNTPPLPLQKPRLQRKPGRYTLRCVTAKRRFARTFTVIIKSYPKRQTIQRRWHPIQVKLMIPLWAYPYADGFFVPRCQIGCIIQLWSGRTTIVLKRPIQGIRRRVTVHKRELELPPALRNAPLSKRTFTIRWEPQKTQKVPSQK